MAKLSMRTRLFAVIVIALAIAVTMVGVLMLSNQQRLLRAMVADSLAAAQRVVDSKLQGKAEQALGVAMAVAGMPEIATGAANRDRTAIVDTVVKVYEEVHAAFGVDVLHVRAPFDTSLVRGQNPEVYGDVQNRGGILDAGRLGIPLWGYDRGPFGMGMRGWAPITADGVVVGTVETNIPFTEQLLQEIHEAVGVELAVFVPGEEGYTLLAFTPGVLSEPELKGLTPRPGESQGSGRSWAHIFFPVLSYDGAELAVVGVYQDIGGYRRMITQQSLQMIIILAVGSGVFIALLLYLMGRVLAPLQTVAQAADAIAAGDLTGELPAVGGRDEVGTLVSAFTGMTASLKEMVGSLAAAIGEMSSASQQLASSTVQARMSMGQVYETADDYSAAAQAMESISSAVNDIVGAAQEGNLVVGQAVVGTEELKETMGRLTEFIHILAQRSEEIGRIVEVISGLAEQTNLLALNAAIEAARAGDEGRGFAVVAEEVRKLAEQSAQAAKEISELIRSIQQETNEAVMGMSQSAQQTAETSQRVSKSGEALARIVATVSRVTGLVEQASRSIEQLNTTSQEISAAAQEQFAVMDEMAAVAQTLNQMAETLQELSGKFKV
ncbi:MAG TPA: HAMP domain-containing protein [Firmicutes bacterium]|nr:HAMP domain-containing protein [Bacillota bacterium]